MCLLLFAETVMRADNVLLLFTFCQADDGKNIFFSDSEQFTFSEDNSLITRLLSVMKSCRLCLEAVIIFAVLFNFFLNFFIMQTNILFTGDKSNTK